MLLLRIERKNIYLSTRHVEDCSGFILISMAFHKFSRCNAKHMVLFTVWKEFYIVTCSSSATNKCGFRIWWLDFYLQQLTLQPVLITDIPIALSLFHVFNNLVHTNAHRVYFQQSSSLTACSWTLTATVGTHSLLSQLHSAITLCFSGRLPSTP
jgi:hypothetical protein